MTDCGFVTVPQLFSNLQRGIEANMSGLVIHCSNKIKTNATILSRDVIWLSCVYYNGLTDTRRRQTSCHWYTVKLNVCTPGVYPNTLEGITPRLNMTPSCHTKQTP